MNLLSVPVREFKARLARYLAEARQGRTIEITSHRKAIARVIGLPRGEKGVEGLIASGAASWRGGKPAGADVRLSPDRRSLSDLVLEERG